MRESKASAMFGAGSAALRGVIAAPLGRVRGKTAGKLASGDSVSAIIENEIIPRLLMAHAAGGGAKRLRQSRVITSRDSARFAMLPLQLEAAGLLGEVDQFIADGASVEAICLDLLAPSARKLGEMWETDECDFLDVTMGLWRLQEVMRDIAARAPVDFSQLTTPRTALFSPMPGDHHNFGTLMIEEVFARGGWQSEALVKPERRELLNRLARQPFDLVGLTLARDCPSLAIANLITAMRKASANRGMVVLIGGRMINENPGLAIEVGADGTGPDAVAALKLAETLVTIPAASRELSLR